MRHLEDCEDDDEHDPQVDGNGQVDLHFPFFLGLRLPLPASLSAMAIAVFSGRPAKRSVRMFSEMTFLLLPFFSTWFSFRVCSCSNGIGMPCRCLPTKA